MKKLLLIAVLVSGLAYAQKNPVEAVTKTITKNEAEAHLAFLASDEMRGRDTGSKEIDIAANYIAAQLKIFGVKPASNGSYFQDVALEKIQSPSEIQLTVSQSVFKLKDDLLLMSGGSSTLDGEVVFVGYGTPDDFNKYDVKGKIVLAYAGSSASTNPVQAILTDGPDKSKRALAKGATALVEIMALPGVPWPALVGFLSSERLVTKKESVTQLPHLLMRNSESESIKTLMESRKGNAKLVIMAPEPQPVKGKNVAGVIEGSDPVLRKEYIAITAHYDHVGVGKANAQKDSIFNGARDNAIGTVALIEAAKYFSLNPPKRSIVFVAVTGEEKGLLGSEWYSNHPLVPLNQTVFNFNCDGAGYNDKSIVTLIDLNRTTADETLKKACETFGLTLKGDPAPEQNLYERSDNLNFAIKGVPAVDFAPGIKSFDQELYKYYHQQADEVASLDMDYLEKFYRSYVYAAHLIANGATKPTWKTGDKFEEAGKKLYGK